MGSEVSMVADGAEATTTTTMKISATISVEALVIMALTPLDTRGSMEMATQTATKIIREMVRDFKVHLSLNVVGEEEVSEDVAFSIEEGAVGKTRWRKNSNSLNIWRWIKMSSRT